MKTTISQLSDQLKRNGIRPSFQRLKILAYLHACQSHPSVEDIYTNLSLEIPSLSKATVYNTLHTFINAGLVREIAIDIDAQHYDAILEDHGHFKCDSCGTISNFNINYDQLDLEGLQAFQIKQKDVFFSGLCPECQQNSPLI